MLSGKNILITGATRGLGRTYALHFAELGANIGIIYRDLYSYRNYEGDSQAMTSETILQELSQYDISISSAKADMTDPQQVNQAVEKIIGELKKIDVVICNAGGGIGSIVGEKASEMDIDVYNQVMEKNLSSTIYTIKSIVPHMKEQGCGKIITVASHVGIIASSLGSYAPYSVSKAGIIHYSKLAAQELGPYGITVNCLVPGFISTPRMNDKFEDAGVKMMIQNTALKRLGKPEECAKVVQFLASDMSDYVTGTVIEVTGGTIGRLYME